MITPIYKDEFYAWIKSINKNIGKTDRHFFGEARISVLYDCDMIVFKEDNGTILSFLSYKVTKNYLNIYFMYTISEYRGKNYSTALIDHVLYNSEKFIGRIYVKASTVHSVAFFKSKGFKLQGQAKNGELLFEQDVFDLQQERKSKKFALEGTENKTLLELIKLPPFNCGVWEINTYNLKDE